MKAFFFFKVSIEAFHKFSFISDTITLSLSFIIGYIHVVDIHNELESIVALSLVLTSLMICLLFTIQFLIQNPVLKRQGNIFYNPTKVAYALGMIIITAKWTIVEYLENDMSLIKFILIQVFSYILHTLMIYNGIYTMFYLNSDKIEQSEKESSISSDIEKGTEDLAEEKFDDMVNELIDKV